MHVPPTCARSTIATRRPASASATASGLPPWPEPITIASYSSSIVLLSAAQLALQRRRDPPARGQRGGADPRAQPRRFLLDGAGRVRADVLQQPERDVAVQPA